MARQIEFDASGKRWRLRLDVNALCQVEAELKMTFTDAVKALHANSILTLRVMFGAALGGKLTGEKVGEIMEDIGLEEATNLLGQAVALAFPQPDPAEGDAPAGN